MQGNPRQRAEGHQARFKQQLVQAVRNASRVLEWVHVCVPVHVGVMVGMLLESLSTLKALMKTLAFKLEAVGKILVLITFIQGTSLAWGWAHLPPAPSCRPTKASLAPVRRRGEQPSWRVPYGGFGGGYGQLGASNLHLRWPQ